MEQQNRSKNETNYINLLALLVMIGAFFYGLYWIWTIIGSTLFPVITALVISYLLHPFLVRLENKGLSRVPAIALVFLSFMAVMALFIVVLYPVIHKEILGISEKMPVIIDAIQYKLIPYMQSNFGVIVPTTVSEAMDNYGTGLKDSLPDLLKKGSSYVFSALLKTGTILSSLLNIILIPVFTLFFLLDFTHYKRSLVFLIPEYKRDKLLTFFRRLDAVVCDWFTAQMKVMFILSLLYGTGIGIVFAFSGFGFMNGFAIGALTGVLNLIPYVGVAVGFLLSISMAIIEWNGIFPLIGIASVFIFVQVSDGYFITPRIVGSKVGLGTVWVLVALLAGGALFGFVGMLFAVPAAAIIKAAWPDLFDLYKESKFYKGPSERNIIHGDSGE